MFCVTGQLINCLLKKIMTTDSKCAKKNIITLETKVVTTVEPNTIEYKKEHKRLCKLAHRKVQGHFVESYRHSVPTISSDDKQAAGAASVAVFHCFVCDDPITESLARKSLSIPIRNDSTPDREKDSNGTYYDMWTPSGFWIVTNGIPESWNPSHSHLACFQSMDQDNFDLFI